MSFEVELAPSGRKFGCDAGETLLSAALRQGLVLPYGCKNGACGSCKGKLLAGEVDYGVYQSKALPEQDRVLGFALLCCATPKTALRLEVREITGLGDVPVRKMPCRVNVIEKRASDVAVLKLQLPANEVLQFKAGQYIEFLLKDGQRRSYSMANSPHDQSGIELHLRHMPGGVFTDHVFTTMKEREILRMEGPMGTFFLREDSNKPMVFLASGTGFAPIKSMIEYGLHKGMNRPLTLYWGGRTKQDLYLLDLAQRWADEYSHIKFVPVLSEALPSDDWTGRTGFVHRAVMQDFPDLSGHQVYACGAPVVVSSAHTDFVALCGLPEDEFFADSFTSAADVV